MSTNHSSKVLIAIAFAGAATLATVTGSQAQDVQSYCLRGSGSVPQCGFATIAQCLNQGAGFGACSPSTSAPDPAFGGASANAKMIKPIRTHHAR
jgi:hypothetical protein